MEGCDKLSKSINRDTQKSTKANNPTTVFYHEVSKLWQKTATTENWIWILPNNLL
jgi:hypothetical protein